MYVIIQWLNLSLYKDLNKPVSACLKSEVFLPAEHLTQHYEPKV